MTELACRDGVAQKASHSLFIKDFSVYAVEARWLFVKWQLLNGTHTVPANGGQEVEGVL